MKLKDQQFWRDGTYNTKPRGQTDRLNQLKSSFTVWTDQQNQNKPYQIYTAYLPMDLATWRTTILSSWNSIAASMYIIRRGKIQKGRGQGGVYASIFFCMTKKKENCCNGSVYFCLLKNCS